MAVLAGKRCIITGGSRGIGLAIARAFASEGASCTLVGRHHDTLSRAAGSLPLATGHVPTGTQSHDAVAFDVGNEKGWLDLGPRYVGEKEEPANFYWRRVDGIAGNFADRCCFAVLPEPGRHSGEFCGRGSEFPLVQDGAKQCPGHHQHKPHVHHLRVSNLQPEDDETEKRYAPEPKLSTRQHC